MGSDGRRLCRSEEATEAGGLDLAADVADRCQVADEGDELLARLGADLLLASVLEDVDKDGDKPVDVGQQDGHDLGVRGRDLEQVEDAAEDDAVLDEVVLERQGLEQDRQDLVERDDVAVLEDDASDGAGSVVPGVAEGGRLGHLLGRAEEERPEDRKEPDDVVKSKLGVHVLDEDTGSKSRVRADLGLRVRQAGVDELEQRLDRKGAAVSRPSVAEGGAGKGGLPGRKP